MVKPQPNSCPGHGWCAPLCCQPASAAPYHGNAPLLAGIINCSSHTPHSPAKPRWPVLPCRTRTQKAHAAKCTRTGVLLFSNPVTGMPHTVLQAPRSIPTDHGLVVATSSALMRPLHAAQAGLLCQVRRISCRAPVMGPLWTVAQSQERRQQTCAAWTCCRHTGYAGMAAKLWPVAAARAPCSVLPKQRPS